MSNKTNGAKARRVPLEVFNEGKLELVDELVAPTFQDHACDGLAPGPDGLKKLVTMMRSAFPDLHYVVEDELVTDDRVVHRITASGTHQGELIGLAPTGKKATWTEIHISRFADGVMVERWASIDHMSVMQQLGRDGEAESPHEESLLDEWYSLYPGF